MKYEQVMRKNGIEITSVCECLKKNISILEYQRPYKWSVHNISDLLTDIEHAIDEKRLHASFKYRIGTIILHKDGNVLHIVDGQQRAISLTLLSLYLNEYYDNSILRNRFTDTVTLTNIHQNYQCITEWFSHRATEKKSAFINAMNDILEVVVIYVDKESEAFQLFDSQNTRGRTLDPHDLLKAYHLREMRGYPYDMVCAVNKWEAKDVAQIRELFSDYLYPIWNWSKGRKTRAFTDKDINTYKGVTADTTYTFARRTYKAMPCYQITEPFIAGGDFFEMVDHYLLLINNIETELKNNRELDKLRPYIETKRCSIGMRHVRKLFKAAVLLFYDRFNRLDDTLALKKIFMWAFMLRVELDNLSYDSVNKYAVGNGISNSLPIFSIISQAWRHSDIDNLIIRVPDEFSPRNCIEERQSLHYLLKRI